VACAIRSGHGQRTSSQLPWCFTVKAIHSPFGLNRGCDSSPGVSLNRRGIPPLSGTLLRAANPGSAV
jgi:hypothetical protein